MDQDPDAPRQSYNFAPGYNGAVYRAVVPPYVAALQGQHGENPIDTNYRSQGHGFGTIPPSPEPSAEATGIRYQIQSMKWGIVPTWPKRHPKYNRSVKIINCRDDSLSNRGGMWAPLKTRQRCIILAQGFYEWLTIGRDKVPYYVRRKDKRLMYFPGLWDSLGCDG